MNKENILNSHEYNFLKEDINLGENVLLLTLAGSLSYGTNIDNSDVDIRGITFERKENVMGLERFEQYDDRHTDTVIYGLKKFILLALKGNPNILELLNTHPDHILYSNNYGKMLRENSHLFLSRRIIHTFGSYATAQLRRLQNALARDEYPQVEKERHILNSIKNQMHHFSTNYSKFESGSIHLYLDESNRKDLESEIYMDIQLKHYPLRDFTSIYSEMRNVVKDYSKLNHRNNKKEKGKLLKHAMHLLRLLITGEEILREGIMHTYREKEQKLLLDIRSGKYSYEEIYSMVDEYEEKFMDASKKTRLPDQPDENKIQKLLIHMYTSYYME